MSGIKSVINRFNVNDTNYLYEYLSKSMWNIKRTHKYLVNYDNETYFNSTLIGIANGNASFIPNNDIFYKTSNLCLDYNENGSYKHYETMKMDGNNNISTQDVMSETFFNKSYRMHIYNDKIMNNNLNNLYCDQQSVFEFMQENNLIDKDKHYSDDILSGIHFDWIYDINDMDYIENKKSINKYNSYMNECNQFYLRYILKEQNINDIECRFESSKHMINNDIYIGYLRFKNEDNFEIILDVKQKDVSFTIETHYSR